MRYNKLYRGSFFSAFRRVCIALTQLERRGNMSTYFIALCIVIVSAHTFLNFKLCGRLSESTRFHKSSIYIFCVINGLLSPLFFTTKFDSPMVFYLIYSAVLLLELILLFKGRPAGIFGVGVGSLVHLFVLRAVIVSATAISKGISMLDIMQDSQLLLNVDVGAFAAQLITLTMFIYLIPLKTVEKIMADKAFYTTLLWLTILISIFLIFNSNMFLTDYISVNLAVQEIVIAISFLLFFYIMLFLMIMIFNLGVYKEKTKELEVQIDKDKALTSAVLSFAEIILEINCTNDRIARLVIDTVERPVEHLPGLSVFLTVQSESYTHPDDIKVIKSINSKTLISDFNNGYTEKMFEYRSKKITSSTNSTGVVIETDDYLWYKMRISLSRDEATQDVIALFTVDEIEKEKQLQLELKKKAETDPLTGAFNKTALAHHVDEHLKSGGQGTLYMFDLDNFKGINDNMGHSAGDVVLCEVYAKIKSIFRVYDLIGRVGGDEFVVFLPGTTKESTVERKATQICDEISKTYHAENGIEIELSSSIGVVVAPRDGQSFDSLFNAADLAMYHSKSIGKSTYTLYDKSLFSSFKPQEKDAYMRQRKALDEEDDNT